MDIIDIFYLIRPSTRVLDIQRQENKNYGAR